MKDIIKKNSLKIKGLFIKFLNWLKKFLSIKRNRIISISAVCLALVIILVIILFSRNDNKFALNEIYDVYPEEVRALYANIVKVSCNGDLHLNLTIDGGKVNVENANKNDLLNYMFSYMDKRGMLDDENLVSVVKNAEKDLFDKKLNLLSEVNSFNYNGNIYDYKNGKITVTKGKCESSDISYVTHLYGFFWDNEKMSMDVNVAYLKNGILYGLDDKKFGEYDGDVSKLPSLTRESSYYRFTYKRNGNNNYKLLSVEWKNRT